MHDNTEARPPGRKRFSASDPEVIAASKAALDALHATEKERRIAEIFSAIDEDTALRIAQLLRSGRQR